jgi:CheY-like chemotaxis protein
VPNPTKRILVVEDHPDSRRVTALILGRAGYEVVSAASKADALKLCETQSFSVLVGDIGLPDGDGYELMTALAKKGDIKGIAFTGYGYESDIVKARAAGYSAHLLKPVDPPQLVEMVAKILEELPKPIIR